MNSRWIIAFLITCVLAIPGDAQQNSGAQTTGDPEGANQTESYPEANSAPNTSRDVAVVAPQACSPDIPQQIIDYLELTPKHIESIRAQLTEQCQQVQLSLSGSKRAASS